MATIRSGSRIACTDSARRSWSVPTAWKTDEMECVYIGLGLFVLLIVGAAFASPSRCTVCGNPIKRKYYTWTLDGKKHRLCPHCNSSMERKRSRDAISRYTR